MTKKTKIGVNGWFFCKSCTGIGDYCLNIFSELARLYPDFEFYIAIPDNLDEKFDKSFRYQDNLKFEIVLENGLLKKIHPGLAKSDWEIRKLNRFFSSKKVDLIHLPYPSLYRKIKGVPVVLTIHDTIPWTDKDYRNRTLLSTLYNYYSLKHSSHADFILTISNASKDCIEKLGAFNGKTLEITYNASKFSYATEILENIDKNLLKKIGLNANDKFLFYVGGFDKRKNVDRLVEIFNQEIAPKTDLKLVIAGGRVLNNNLFSKVKTVSPRIIQTGFLDNAELMFFFKHAWAFITFTASEGFNLSLLDSITLGCPVFASDIQVHREVASNIPCFLPLSMTNTLIAEKILHLYNDDAAYLKWKSETMKFSKKTKEKYSWSKTARQIGKIYLQILKKHF